MRDWHRKFQPLHTIAVQGIYHFVLGVVIGQDSHVNEGVVNFHVCLRLPPTDLGRYVELKQNFQPLFDGGRPVDGRGSGCVLHHSLYLSLICVCVCSPLLSHYSSCSRFIAVMQLSKKTLWIEEIFPLNQWSVGCWFWSTLIKFGAYTCFATVITIGLGSPIIFSGN